MVTLPTADDDSKAKPTFGSDDSKAKPTFGSAKEYEGLKKIGDGSYGIVYKAKHRRSGRMVAIKRFKEPEDTDEYVRKTALREIKLNKQLQHTNITALLEVYRDKRLLHLVFEWVDRTLVDALGMSGLLTKLCMWQLLRAVRYCHANGIVHRDISPKNVLVSDGGLVKLCDFGFARAVSNSAKLTEYVGQRWYRAPELLIGHEYAASIDVWALGVTLPEVRTGRPLFPGTTEVDTVFRIVRTMGPLPEALRTSFGARPFFKGAPIEWPPTRSLTERFPGFTADVIDLLSMALVYDPAARASCEALLSTSYFTDDSQMAPVRTAEEAGVPAAVEELTRQERAKQLQQKQGTSTRDSSACSIL